MPFYDFPFMETIFEGFMDVSCFDLDLIESNVNPFDFLALLLACVIHI